MNPNLLIEASAGTGKTQALANRRLAAGDRCADVLTCRGG